MLRSHLDGVLSWTKARVSNGAVEGMSKKIKSIRHRSFGFWTPRTSLRQSITAARACRYLLNANYTFRIGANSLSQHSWGRRRAAPFRGSVIHGLDGFQKNCATPMLHHFPPAPRSLSIEKNRSAECVETVEILKMGQKSVLST